MVKPRPLLPLWNNGSSTKAAEDEDWGPSRQHQAWFGRQSFGTGTLVPSHLLKPPGHQVHAGERGRKRRQFKVQAEAENPLEKMTGDKVGFSLPSLCWQEPHHLINQSSALGG